MTEGSRRWEAHPVGKSQALNQLVASAVGEKIAATEAETYLAERAKRGAKVDIASILAKVPDAPPAPEDAL